GDVGLAGLVVKLGLAGGRDAVDFAAIAGADVESSVGRERERPDVLGLGVEIFGGLAVDDFVDLAVGGGGGVDGVSGIGGNGEDFGFGGGPVQGRLAGGIDFINAAAVAGSGVDGTVGSFGEIPDDGLAGGEEGVEFGTES